MSTTSTRNDRLEELAVNTIRIISAEAVDAAKSGHPGLPMGCADFAFTLFTRFLDFDPTRPDWPNRDRFVLSAGHGSMLLYSMLHLSGYELPLEELKRFRQWGSKTPGHPEFGHTPGVETTTGPLGAGISNAVGMALAERLLAARYNTPEHAVVDHFTYAIVSDGDLMEGISHEAASIAGHLRLAKLILFYDDNGITIEGETSLAFTEDEATRFEAYGWHVQRVDGHDRSAIARALENAREETSRPSIVIGRTTIGYGSPNKAGTHDVHGAPLGGDELAATKANLGWSHSPFTVPEEVRTLFSAPGERGRESAKAWDALFADYREKHPDLAAEFLRTQTRKLPEGWRDSLPRFTSADKAIATRAASGKVINAIASTIPELIGGSADLAPSNNTMVKDGRSVGPEDFGARNLHFGVREHGMGGVLNGLSLHGGIRPYGGTFLVFSDYMRPAIRLAAISAQPVIYVFTHDSIFLGEDGPTHQPIEHIAALRAIPNLRVLRPADANETAAAWAIALEHTSGPTALLLTRQNLPIHDETALAKNGAGPERGAYIVRDAKGGAPELIFLASGSELHVAIDAAKTLEEEGRRVRVVSMLSFEIFEEQDASYRNSVLPREVTRRVGVEAAIAQGWERYLGAEGLFIGMSHFGASAPANVLAEKFGFTASNVAAKAKSLF